jgi:tRNA (cytidine56-2'-O)-methyltransferase
MYVTSSAPEVKESIDKVVQRWGGEFQVKEVDNYRDLIRSWKDQGGLVVHLTMYGICVNDVIDELIEHGKDVLVVVGAEKVPPDIYSLSHYNLAVGNQPHSEVAALAVFLDRYSGGEELKRNFNNCRVRIVPSKMGKRVDIVG